ncbi:hypothetical protein [Streptomyces sp. NBC_01602]
MREGAGCGRRRVARLMVSSASRTARGPGRPERRA